MNVCIGRSIHGPQLLFSGEGSNKKICVRVPTTRQKHENVISLLVWNIREMVDLHL